MYETLDQKEPVFDAKGIETVRRDTCPAVAKVSLLCVVTQCVKLLNCAYMSNSEVVLRDVSINDTHPSVELTERYLKLC